MPGVVREAAQLLLQSLFAGQANRLDLLRQLGIRILLGKYQAAIVDVPARHNLVPGLRCPEGFQLVQGVPEVGCRLFHIRALPCFLRAVSHGPNLAVQVVVEVIDQIAAPERLRHIRYVLRFRSGQTALQPALRVQVAPGAVIDGFDDFRHQAVIPAQPLAVHEGPEIRVFSRRFVGPVQ